MKRLAWAVVCCLCAVAARADDAADPYAGIRSVAIVSMIGDGLTLKQDRDLFGAAAADAILATGTDIDRFIKAHIRAELRAIIGASPPNALRAARLTTQGNDIKPKMWDGRTLLCHEFG